METVHLKMSKADLLSSDHACRNGAPVLIAEDEFRIGLELAEEIENEGIRVVGPVPTTLEAFSIIGRERPIECAVLDVNLADSLVFPVADRLAALGVPFAFITADDDVSWPERFAFTPKFQKPVTWADIKTVFFKPMERWSHHSGDRSFRRELDASLPQLRVIARKLAHGHGSADDLVEATLKDAIQSIRRRPRQVPVLQWLVGVMTDVAARRKPTIN